MSESVIVVHGGAGARRADSDLAECEVRRALATAVVAAHARIGSGALAACVAAVRSLEDCPLLNAGTGSVLAADGAVWCDAAVMDGEGRAGAVCAVQGLLNPIIAALALLHEGSHVLWAGAGAELAQQHGLTTVDPRRMVTDTQRQHLRELRGGRGQEASGTVGAVCLDADGHLAAATSTGGVIGKPPSRVGDSPLLGAGTWAHARTCAVSATGDGEAFIRSGFAFGVHARLRWGGQKLAAAAAEALREVGQAGGRGGAICLGADGAIAMPISTELMHRAWQRGDGPVHTAIGAHDAGSEHARPR